MFLIVKQLFDIFAFIRSKENNAFTTKLWTMASVRNFSTRDITDL